MTPFVRGRILPEIQSTGRIRHTLDIMVWMTRMTPRDITALNDVCMLKEYLSSLVPSICDIRFYVPEAFDAIQSFLRRFHIPFLTVSAAPVTSRERDGFKGEAPIELLQAMATALSCGCDLILVGESDWFCYWRELDGLNLLAVDVDVLKRQCEIFVRGHDVAWSFADMAWSHPWTGFYMMVEHSTFRVGLQFLELYRKRKLPSDSMETGRMLVYNRLPNLCFTRDRLLFFEMQRRAAKRAQWTNQKFRFEVGYFLEFYYLLIFGGLDSIAVLLNGALNLGVRPRRVAAQSQAFLQSLEKKAPEIHAAFTAPEFSEFHGRIASLRHLAAHRGSIMPGPVYEKRDVDPTKEELDKEIRRRGLESNIQIFPEGPVRDWARDHMRFKVNLEMAKKILDDVLLVEIKGEYGFIRPMDDIEWTFSRFHTFMVKVLEASGRRIEAGDTGQRA